MPYPKTVTPDRILVIAQEMLESDGIDGLSLHKIAAKLKVKTPSLYRYIQNKEDLLRQLRRTTMTELTSGIMANARIAGEPKETLLEMAIAYRAYALQHPRQYELAFSVNIPISAAEEMKNEQLVEPIQQLVTALTGDAQSLTMLRGLLAILHGWILLEISEQFRRGGNLESEFQAVVEHYLNSLG